MDLAINCVVILIRYHPPVSSTQGDFSLTLVKLRVKQGTLSPKALGQIHGIGPKTVTKAEEFFSFEPAK